MEQTILAQVVADEELKTRLNQWARLAAPPQIARTRIGIDLPSLHPGAPPPIGQRCSRNQPFIEGTMDGIEPRRCPHRIGIIDQPAEQAAVHLTGMPETRNNVH